MSKNVKGIYIFLLISILIGLPVLFFILGDLPHRTILKNSISLITILSFFILFAQFFLSKINSSTKEFSNFANVIKIHKFIGYVFLLILIVHPILIVVPRFFEVGVYPFESFIKMITTFDTLGVLLGIIAWILMFCLGITSMFRNKLNISYKSWKIFHGILSLTFLIIASWHAIDMGRHVNLQMSILIIFLVLISVVSVLKVYLFNCREGANNA